MGKYDDPVRLMPMSAAQRTSPLPPHLSKEYHRTGRVGHSELTVLTVIPDNLVMLMTIGRGSGIG